jgi:hypothetical protein
MREAYAGESIADRHPDPLTVAWFSVPVSTHQHSDPFTVTVNGSSTTQSGPPGARASLRRFDHLAAGLPDPARRARAASGHLMTLTARRIASLSAFRATGLS